MKIDDIKPGVTILPSRNVTYGTTLYNNTSLYNSSNNYIGVAGQSGIYPTVAIDQFKPSVTSIDGLEDTYYVIFKQGQPFGLLLALTNPNETKEAI